MTNPNNFKTTKEAMAFVRDFMNTNFEVLVEKAENGEEGYGIMEDPKDSYIFDLDNNLTTPNN